MKKFIAIFLSLLTIFSVGVISASAKTKYLKKDGFVYVVSDGEAQICFYYGKSKSVSYPSRLGGYKVTKIGFDYDRNDTGVKPNKKLEKITIPDSVTELEPRCFDSFKKLKSVTFGKSLKKLPGFCFSDCTSLESITIPAGIKRLCWGAFINCSKLVDVKFPNSLKVIEYCVFCRSGLKSVTIPKNVKMLGNTTYDAFGVFEASPLEEFKVASGNKTFCAKDGVLYNKKKTALCLYPENKSGAKFTVPNSVKKICYNSFNGNKNLNSVMMGKKVKAISSWAFYSSEKLEKITFNKGLEAIGSCAFDECRALKSAKLPDSVKRINSCAFLYCEKLKSFTSGKSLEKIGDSAFADCTALTDVKLNTKAELTIHKNAFLGCNKMKSITLPKNVKKIGDRAVGFFDVVNDDYDEDDPDFIRIGKIKGFKIYGKKGTAAEAYAEKYGFKFKEN